MAWIATRHRAWAITAVALLSGPALAQAPDRAATTPPPPAANRQLYSFTLQNLASKAIERATAHMTNGATADVTAKGKIMPNQGQSFGANNGGCLASISVTFAGGATLESAPSSDCGNSTIVVRDDKIDLTSSASRKMVPPPEPSDH